jgi:hypothetical protein
MKLNFLNMVMAFLLAAFAMAVPIFTDHDSPTSVTRRQDSSVPVEFCNDINFSGCTWYSPQYGICQNLGKWAGISSVSGLLPGDWCVLFSYVDCQGDSVRVENIADLGTVNFNDVPASYACYSPI